MTDPGEIARFHDRCSDLMRELLEALAEAPGRPRPFPEIEDALGWPRRRPRTILTIPLPGNPPLILQECIFIMIKAHRNFRIHSIRSR